MVVVNDGSDDATPYVAMGNEAILINNSKNLGKGDALKKGFTFANGYFVVTLDADGEHQPEEIPNLLYPVINGDDDVAAVLGSRFIGKRRDRATTLLHIVGNKIFNALIFASHGDVCF